MKFGVHNLSWLSGPDPAEIFEAVRAGSPDMVRHKLEVLRRHCEAERQPRDDEADDVGS